VKNRGDILPIAAFDHSLAEPISSLAIRSIDNQVSRL
jgi:hypothetical protein